MRPMIDILQSAPFAILQLNSNASIVFANKTAIDLFGVENLIGISYSSLDKSISREGVHLNLGLIKQGFLSKFETVYENSKGIEIDAEVIATCESTPDSPIFTFYISDITSKKATIEKNHATYQQMEAILESIPDPVLLKNSTNRWLYANKAARELHGFREADYLQKTSHELTQDFPNLSRELEEDKEWCDKTWAAAEPTVTVFRMGQSGLGNARVFEVVRVPLFQNQKTPWMMVTFWRDQTRIAEAQAAAEDLYLMLGSVVQNTSIGIALLEAGTMRFANSRFRELIKSIAGCENRDLDASVLRSLFHNLLTAAGESNEHTPHSERVWFPSASGQKILYGVEVLHFTSSNDAPSFTIFLRDFTEVERVRRGLFLLEERVDNVREMERMRFAQEVHDRIGGMAAAVSMRLGSLVLTHGEDGIGHELKLCEEICGSIAESVRAIVRDLGNNPTEGMSFRDAIQHYAARFCGLRGLEWVDNYEGEVSEVPLDIRNGMVTMLRECTAYAEQHGASAIKIDILVRESSADMIIGLVGELKSNTIGIPILHAVAESINARISLDKSKSSMTISIEFQIPIRTRQEK